jgi:hypothetical protein
MYLIVKTPRAEAHLVGLPGETEQIAEAGGPRFYSRSKDDLGFGVFL